MLETVGELIGSLYKGVNAPVIEQRREAVLEMERQRLALQAEQAAKARQSIVALEQQKQQAGQPVEVPYRTQTFGLPEEIELLQAYGQANIDPTARLKAQLFEDNVAKVQNPAALINIAQGKEYKPVSYSGGVAYNQYDPQNPFIGTTDKYAADTSKAQSEADLTAQRLKYFNKNIDLINDPLLQMDAAQNKSVFNAQKVEIEGKDGKTHQGMATLNPSGKYEASAVTDASTGEPLTIPAESSNKTSPEMIKAREMVEYGFAKSIPDAMEIIYSSKDASPDKRWSDIVTSNTKNPFTGQRLPPHQVMRNSIEQWAMEKRGQPFPDNVVETLDILNIEDREKAEILASVDSYNKAFTPAPAPAPNPAQQQVATNIAAQLPTAPTAAGIPPVIPDIAPAQQPAQLPAQQETLQPLTPLAIQTAFTQIRQGEKPEAVKKELQQSGFDLSEESVNRLAIDAINSGVPAEELQQYFSLIGIDWQTP